MATQSRKRQADLFGGPDWSEDSSSKYECNSPPDSPILSSGYESLILDDLDLYEARYLC